MKTPRFKQQQPCGHCLQYSITKSERRLRKSTIRSRQYILCRYRFTTVEQSLAERGRQLIDARLKGKADGSKDNE